MTQFYPPPDLKDYDLTPEQHESGRRLAKKWEKGNTVIFGFIAVLYVSIAIWIGYFINGQEWGWTEQGLSRILLWTGIALLMLLAIMAAQLTNLAIKALILDVFFPHAVRVNKYESAVKAYNAEDVRLQNQAQLLNQIGIFQEGNEAEETGLFSEYETSPTEWHRELREAIPERDIIKSGRELRIRGSYLLNLLDWRQFEVLMKELLESLKWKAETTSMGADMGVDVIAHQGERKLYLQAKHYKSGKNVGRADVQRLIGTATVDNCTDAIMASSSSFTRQANEYLKGYDQQTLKLEYWDGNKITSLIDALNIEEYKKLVDPMKPKLLISIKKN